MRSTSASLRSTASYAITHVDDSGTKTARVEEFEIPSEACSECRPSAGDDHGVEEQLTFIDEIGVERTPRKLGAANDDVVLRFPLERPNSLAVELPLDSRVACRRACQRS